MNPEFSARQVETQPQVHSSPALVNLCTKNICIIFQSTSQTVINRCSVNNHQTYQPDHMKLGIKPTGLKWSQAELDHETRMKYRKQDENLIIPRW